MLTGKFDKAQTWIKKALTQQPNDETLKQCLAAAQKGELPAELRKQIEPEKLENVSPPRKSRSRVGVSSTKAKPARPSAAFDVRWPKILRTFPR